MGDLGVRKCPKTAIRVPHVCPSDFNHAGNEHRQHVELSPRMNPVGEKTVWEENSPDSLVDICTRDETSFKSTLCLNVTKLSCRIFH